ncbi:hypothetical protein WN48_00442 [Eufriesea mexicana]|nr:hypothetical protein WN48_00442 [Eufriesea mexicana]
MKEMDSQPHFSNCVPRKNGPSRHLVRLFRDTLRFRLSPNKIPGSWTFCHLLA